MVAVLRRRVIPYLLLGPGTFWLVLFFVVPLYYMFKLSLETGIVGNLEFNWHWANYSEALDLYHSQLVRSFIYAGVATGASLLLAYPLAYAIAFKAGRYRNLMLFAVVAPFFTTYLIRTLAWETILSDQSPVTEFMHAVGLAPSGHVLATSFAVIAGLTYNFLPFMILPIYASLERVDPRFLEAAGDLYANGLTTLRKVTVPLSMPGVVAGTLLTFIPAAGDYVNAALLGSRDTTMVGNVIESRFLRVVDYPTAAVLSVTLMVSILVLVGLYIRRAGTEELV